MKKSVLYLVCMLYLCSFHKGVAQDSLRLKDMQQFAYPFSIENQEFLGKGGEVLTKALANAHITMLGDNNLSKLEYEFTNALIKELDRNAYNKMVLEVGPSSAKVLNQLSSNPTQTTTALKTLNQTYGLDRKGKLLVPIPEFKSTEAAQYLQTAKERDWSVWAIGPESWISYTMILDELFNNLSVANKAKHQAAFLSAKTFLVDLYASVPKQNNEELAKFTSALKSSKEFNDFLELMANYNNNIDLLNDLNYSMEHWSLYGKRDFYEENKIHAEKGKTALAKILNNNEFDFSKDKLFIKMWVSYLAKSTNISGFYGVGNMLHELTAYHGNTSLNIAIARRFYEDNGEVKDILVGRGTYINFKELIPLGKKNEWVLVDLRPFHKAFFWKGMHMSTPMHKIIARYDILVIPKADSKATTNY